MSFLKWNLCCDHRGVIRNSFTLEVVQQLWRSWWWKYFERLVKNYICSSLPSSFDLFQFAYRLKWNWNRQRYRCPHLPPAAFHRIPPWKREGDLWEFYSLTTVWLSIPWKWDPLGWTTLSANGFLTSSPADRRWLWWIIWLITLHWTSVRPRRWWWISENSRQETTPH